MTYLVRLLAGTALIAVLSGLAACDRSPEVSAGPKPPGVTVVAVAQRSVPVYGQYVGQTEAVKTVEVRARVEGFIERQVAPDGADVKAGDLLFVIDPRPFEAALRQAEANVARDTAQLRQAEAALTQREADVRQAQANVDRDLAQVENARTQEERYRSLLQQELIAREQYDQIRTNMTSLEATVQGRPRRPRERPGRAGRGAGGHRERAGRRPRRRGGGRHRPAPARVHVGQVAARWAHGPGRGPGGRLRRARARRRSWPPCPPSIRCTSTSA